MARVITNLTRIGMIQEVTPGTTPATPAFVERRVTKENFMPKRLFTRSEQFNSARSLVDLYKVAERAEGGFSFEWCDGENEDLLENLMWGTWNTDVLVNGWTRKSHSCEVRFEGGATDQFKLLAGLQVSEFELNMPLAEKATGSFSFVGMSSSFPVTNFTGATYVAPSTEPVNVTGDMVLTSTGLAVNEVSRISMKVNNNARIQQCLGSFQPSGIGVGTFDVTGEIEFYLNTGVVDHFGAYINNTAFSLGALLGNTTLKKTRFDVPRAKLSDLTIIGEGNDQDVMVKCQWVATYDSTTNGALKITRNIA